MFAVAAGRPRGARACPLSSSTSPLARLENIAVLSIGTGAQASSLPCQSDDEALGPLQVRPCHGTERSLPLKERVTQKHTRIRFFC